MVNWYALGLAAALIYIAPKRLIFARLRNFYKYRTITIPRKAVVVILDDIGLNYEKARLQARKGSRIIIGAANRVKAQLAKEELQWTTNNKNIIIIPVNRHDKSSLKTFAREIVDSEVTVDVIINNEGRQLVDLDIVFKTQQLAKERFENHCLNFLHSPEHL